MFEIINNMNYLEMFEAIVKTSYDGIFITDGEARVIYISSGYERITGLKREDMIGRHMDKLVESGYISEPTSYRVLQTKKPVTVHQDFSTGKSALVTSSPFFNENGEIKMIVTNVRDITELKELQEKDKQRKIETSKYKDIIEELKLQIANNEFIVAEDEKMLNLLLLAKRVARVDTTILINGETGSGKEVLAKYIYNNSSRKDKPFIKINCGAIPENLIESEFFGYTEGSFTGAIKGGKIGIFEAANNGTLLLDEVSELPLSMQVKFLRVIQEGEIVRIGNSNAIKVDVRIIATSNRDLRKMVDNGLFREDLYYRLNVVPLNVIPLRERPSSIIPTVEYYLNVFNQKYGFKKTISKEALKYLYLYPWPGNIRELRNLVERLTITSIDNIIYKEDLPNNVYKTDEQNDSDTNIKLKDALEKVEKEMIFRAYERHGNVRAAAEELGIDNSTFVRKRQKYS